MGGAGFSRCSGVMGYRMGKSWVHSEGYQDMKSQKKGKVEGKMGHRVG